MKLLEDRIIKDGVVLPGNILKVDGFLNHQLDIPLFVELAKEFKRIFSGCNINKILTIEASGIGLASIIAEQFGCPVVFAKKSRTKNLSPDVYSAKVFSYTHGEPYDALVSKKYLSSNDNLLIVDDFLAMGEALSGLWEISKQAGCRVCGAGIAVEKAFQPGGEKLRQQGLRIESLAKISSMDGSEITFC